MKNNNEKFYSLPDLRYNYDVLVPFVSEQQLRIHHQKHHAGYVAGANASFEALDQARNKGIDLDMKAVLKNQAFHLGGYLLHIMFWKNLAPVNAGAGEPSGKILQEINDEFGSFERFQKEFSQTALSTEGSGWAALVYCKRTKRPLLMQIEKHNVNVYPNFKILLVLDVWEHAYYIDYKNDRAKYVEAFWQVVNWKKVEERFERVVGK
ncbi:superoxide dismutase [Candidatus Parcubacteria bacterium]|nr:superoxide dismutase [Candidatus Parcubacteria bacterium]